MMKERLRVVRKELGLTQQEMAQHLGIGKAALSMIETGRAGLSARNLNILVQKFNINPEWLEKGEGRLFSSSPNMADLRQNASGTLQVPLQSVPLYSIEGLNGLETLFASESRVKPINYIHIPNLPKCDGALYISGDSMYPLLNSGDIILYKQLNLDTNIFWGDMYLVSVDVDGEEYVTVKYIKESSREGYIKLASHNPHHTEKEIQRSRIRAIATVKASIRMNAM